TKKKRPQDSRFLGRRQFLLPRPPPVAKARLMTLDEALDRLHRAGWSAGDVVAGGTWIVFGHNGENLMHATGRTQAIAWRHACEQAAAVGMLAPPRPGDDDHEHALRRFPLP